MSEALLQTGARLSPSSPAQMDGSVAFVFFNHGDNYGLRDFNPFAKIS